MTRALDPAALAATLTATLPGAVRSADATAIVLHADHLDAAVRFLRSDPDLDLVFLSNLTAVDRESCFEVVYHLQSLDLNQIVTVKVLTDDRQDPHVPTLTTQYHGAWLQEREVYDLFGIRFDGHPDLRRMFLWEGFPGFPLRKDFLAMPEPIHAGLPGFPHESGVNAWPVPGSVAAPSGAGTADEGEP